MIKEEIRIKKVIVHILDSTVGLPVLSDKEIEFGSDFADFLKEHIYKVASCDDCKPCRFYEKEKEPHSSLMPKPQCNARRRFCGGSYFKDTTQNRKVNRKCEKSF